MLHVSGARSGVGLGAFFADKYEVTNRDFKPFIDNSGYDNSNYWRHDFVKDGVIISWQEAMSELRDQTDKPGPATWREGQYPQGEDEFPVRGVSWYEAAAYAEFVNKSLPTIHHWARAAHLRDAPFVVPLSNFSGEGPAAVGSHQGIGLFGLYDTAGNVKEWCWNSTADGKRWIRGGAWDEPGYMFIQHDAASPFSRSPTFGFRCVTHLEEPSSEALAAMTLHQRDYSLETPATSEELEVYRQHYLYDADLPLNPTIVSVEGAGEGYRHEIVHVDAAYATERLILHLFLPRNAKSPYQTVVYFPGAGANWRGQRPLNRASGSFGFRLVLGLVERGHAVCWPVYKSTFDRHDGIRWPRMKRDSLRYRDLRVQLAKDLARSIDYLETRPDVNAAKLAYVGFSWGAILGPIMAVVEPRLRSCVWISGGLGYEREKPAPEVDPFNFARAVEVPVLMLNGRYDQLFRIEESQVPLFELLGSTDKDLFHLESGHSPPEQATIRRTSDWLERHFGPVARHTH